MIMVCFKVNVWPGFKLRSGVRHSVWVFFTMTELCVCVHACMCVLWPHPLKSESFISFSQCQVSICRLQNSKHGDSLFKRLPQTRKERIKYIHTASYFLLLTRLPVNYIHSYIKVALISIYGHLFLQFVHFGLTEIVRPSNCIQKSCWGSANDDLVLWADTWAVLPSKSSNGPLLNFSIC